MLHAVTISRAISYTSAQWIYGYNEFSCRVNSTCIGLVKSIQWRLCREEGADSNKCLYSLASSYKSSRQSVCHQKSEVLKYYSEP